MHVFFILWLSIAAKIKSCVRVSNAHLGKNDEHLRSCLGSNLIPCYAKKFKQPVHVSWLYSTEIEWMFITNMCKVGFCLFLFCFCCLFPCSSLPQSLCFFFKSQMLLTPPPSPKKMWIPANDLQTYTVQSCMIKCSTKTASMGRKNSYMHFAPEHVCKPKHVVNIGKAHNYEYRASNTFSGFCWL